MKTLLKRVVKDCAWIAGTVIPPMRGTRILTYHAIGPRRHEMTVGLEAFRWQMAWLAEAGCVVPLAAALEGAPGVAITFDDGFVDNLRLAAPILSAFGLPAVVFVVAGRAGGYLDREPDPEHGRLMDWEELRELRGHGVEIGAHTLNHPHLARLGEAAQAVEIVESKALIEERLGCAVRYFAYPYGSALDYDALSMALARGAGYALACSNRYGVNGPGSDPWQLRRIWIDRSDGLESFQAKVRGRMDSLRLLDSGVGIRLRRGVNRMSGRGA